MSNISIPSDSNIPCGCLARLHSPIGSCGRCGKIACSLESMNCTFCGSRIMSLIDTQKDNAPPLDPSDDTALEYRNVSLIDLQNARKKVSTLVEMDRTNSERTRVEDADGSWYNRAGNMWISRSERLQAIKNGLEEERRRIQSRQRITVGEHDTFNILSIGDIDEEMSKLNREAKIQDTLESSLNSLRIEEENRRSGQKFSNDTAAELNADQQSLFEILKNRVSTHFKSLDDLQKNTTTKNNLAAVQRAEEKLLSEVLPHEELHLEESAIDRMRREYRDCIAVPEECHYIPPSAFPFISDALHRSGDGGDKGICITMHQPWAGLLVAGIKTLEGRIWQTTHVGRLWIHAAAKQPTHDSDIESISKRVLDDARRLGCQFPPLPLHWPTSCLLGCVEVTNNVKLEDIPALAASGHCLNEGNTSEWQMVCWAPKKLPLPIRMSGEHKYWRLPFDVHETARRAIIPVKYPCIPSWSPKTVKLDSIDMPAVPSIRHDPTTKIAGSNRNNGDASQTEGEFFLRRKLSLAEKAANGHVLPASSSFTPKKAIAVKGDNGVILLKRSLPRDVMHDIADELDGAAREQGQFWFEGFCLPNCRGTFLNSLGKHFNVFESCLETKRNDLDGNSIISISENLRASLKEMLADILKNSTTGEILKKLGFGHIAVKWGHAEPQWVFARHLSSIVGSGFDPVQSPADVDESISATVIAVYNGEVKITTLNNGTDEQRLKNGDVWLLVGDTKQSQRGYRLEKVDSLENDSDIKDVVVLEVGFKI